MLPLLSDGGKGAMSAGEYGIARQCIDLFFIIPQLFVERRCQQGVLPELLAEERRHHLALHQHTQRSRQVEGVEIGAFAGLTIGFELGMAKLTIQALDGSGAFGPPTVYVSLFSLQYSGCTGVRNVTIRRTLPF